MLHCNPFGEHNFNDLYAKPNEIDLGIFERMLTPEGYKIVYGVSGHELLNEVNTIALPDYYIMVLIKRYFGKFFPLIVNVVTLGEFISSDRGAATAEFFNVFYDYTTMLEALRSSNLLNDNVYPLRELVTGDDFPIAFEIFNVVSNRDFINPSFEGARFNPQFSHLQPTPEQTAAFLASIKGDNIISTTQSPVENYAHDKNTIDVNTIDTSSDVFIKASDNNKGKKIEIISDNTVFKIVGPVSR